MGQIASMSQLRMSFLRWAMVTVPGIVFLGFLSGRLSNSGWDNRWFQALDKPEIVPPGWVFGAVWGTLYLLMGLALAMVLHARGAHGRQMALGLFGGQLFLNLCWTPLFFAAHQVSLALLLIIVILLLAAATAWWFRRIRPIAGLLLVPYLAWLCFAAFLNFQIDRMNPDAETLAPTRANTQIQL